MNDIDSLKKRVAELEKANRDLDDIFNAMEDLVFVINKDNIVTIVNNACASFLKTEPRDIIGKKCYELMHRLGNSWPGCPFEKTKNDKKAHTEEINDPNIGLMLLVTTSPIFSDSGDMIGAVHTAKNITEYKKQEEVLSKKLRDLEIFYKAAIDREMKIKELKKKIAELEARLK